MADIDDNVIQALYQAAAGEVPWNAALNGLQASVNGASTQILVVDKAKSNLALADCSDTAYPDAILEHVREYHRCDPHFAVAAGGPVGQVLNTQDSFPMAEYRNHPFYRDHWLAYGVHALLGAKVAEDERYMALIGMTRVTGYPPFAAVDVALFGRYIRHLIAAFEIAKFLAKVRTEAIVGQRLMQSSSRPMILVAHDQTILTMNDPARRLLDTADSCYVRDGRFHCKMNESAARLRDVISAFSSQRSPQERVPTRDRMAFRIHGPDGSPVWCSAWDMRPELVLGLFGPVAAVLLILTPQQSSQPADSLWLGSMFDLTPTEARVASALMTGVDLESIAAQHQVSLGTVRTQLRSIYEKTGTHRQAQLVALLHAAGNA